jgi:hypothetical protein
MRARGVGKRITLIDRDTRCAALENREQIGGALQHFASGVQVVSEPGAGHIERAHSVEAEQIEGRNQCYARNDTHCTPHGDASRRTQRTAVVLRWLAKPEFSSTAFAVRLRKDACPAKE